jgi:hypothetical protein
MQRWSKRAIEEANLFNPAFCSIVLARAARDFPKKTQRYLPFALAVLVLPIVLHQGTRNALPHSTITSLLTWVQENRHLLVEFSKRVSSLMPITREAILFGISHQNIALNSAGDLLPGSKYQEPIAKRAALFTDEVRECIDRGGFIGRWFAVGGTVATIYSAWGIRP